jgi:hypothetical protein
MALKRAKKNQTEAVSILGVQVSSDLPDRLQKLSEQTGLSSHNLLQKWILQEELWIGVMQRDKGQMTGRTQESPKKTRQQVSGTPQQKETQEEAAEINPNKSKSFHKTLSARIKKLQKEGMTLKKIADILNDENLPTLSGRGRWHASTIIRFMNAKI